MSSSLTVNTIKLNIIEFEFDKLNIIEFEFDKLKLEILNLIN